MTAETQSAVQFRFPDSHVLITGGSHGIGHRLAHEFADAGAVVTITRERALREAEQADRDFASGNISARFP